MDHQHHVVENALSSFFDQSDFMPHGHCYLWKPPLVITHVTSDFLIGMAYLGISLTLYALIKKIKLPFSPVFVFFGIFIGACGITHFMELITLWNPVYWVSGFVKVVTAVASVFTCVALYRLKPNIISFAAAAKLSEERKIKLESAHAELEVLYEKVKESDRLKTQFFANISHELRTPIALILGPAEDLMDSATDPKAKQRLDVILRNARMLLKHVNDLLDISKLEAGHMKPRYARTDLVKLFRFVMAHFETLMQSRSIFFSLHAPDSILADVDAEKVQRVYMNLLSNAVKFAPEGGRIRVSMQVRGDQVDFTIEDTGPGVSASVRDVIFERFRQGDERNNREVGGTGLGLAIVKDFVQLHAGSVELLSGGAPGAKFLVTLPLHAPAGATVAEAEVNNSVDRHVMQGSIDELKSDAPLGEGALPFRANLATVLVCEDNPDMNRFICETLATNFNVISSTDGRDGMNHLSVQKPDLVVSDIMMPNLSGDQLVEAMQSDASLRHIPILLLSAKADDEMRISLLRSGASDYLIKPFAADELRVRAGNLVLMKHARDVLQREVSVRSENLITLAEEVSSRKRDVELALAGAQAARLEAERASLAKGMFLNLVSHELNTPVSAMVLAIQMLQSWERDSLTPKQRMLVDGLSNSFKTLKVLVEGLLQYVRTGADETRSTLVDLKDEVQQAIQEFTPMAEQKKLTLTCVVEGEPRLVTDARKYKIILSNLVMNALKFTAQGSVTVSVSESDNKTYLRVRDTGLGIAAADVERIFKPFERIEPLERKSVPGVGLGLSLVRRLAQELGGEVTVESTLGVGSTFTVELPSSISNA